jgi:competence protein ComEC
LISGKGIISTDLYPEFKYGDLIKISGKLEKPTNFSKFVVGATTSSNFDYVSYLGKDYIFYKINFAKAEFVSSGHGNVIKSILFEIKNSFINNVSKTIQEPESSLLSGILLGAKSSMDKATTEIFRRAGLSHIVALSGYNITVVADAIMKILSVFPRQIGFFGGIVGVIIFVIMSGASSTAVRAGIMALIVILARITRRNYQAGRALIIAGFLMIVVNPKILVFDMSFQLSFLATLAIIYVSPILKMKFNFITERFGLRDVVASTLAAQILVLPLILYKMGLLSLVALPANILVLAFIPATMFFGFITGSLGFIWLPLSLPFAWISWLLLAYIVSISNFLANLPFSAINISWFSSVIMFSCYFFIIIWIIFENNKTYRV